MPETTIATVLREHGIRPSAHRVAIAAYVLRTDEHPSADQTWAKVRRTFPVLSRATTYNTLNLFVEKGLLRQFALTEGRLVFDANIDLHHHFIDEKTGRIYDIPWDSLAVRNVSALKGFDVHEYQVVMRGRRTSHAMRRRNPPHTTGKKGRLP